MVEAKPWYWGAPYEVASHPFDVFALARGWRRLGMPRYAAAALRGWRAWVEHLGSDGRPASHHPGPGRTRSYQCPLFWAAHASWMARALGDLEAAHDQPDEPPSRSGGNLEIGVTCFPDASLVRLEDGAVTAWVRGARPAANAHHGSPHGAGLLRVVARGTGEELLARSPRGGSVEGEWTARRGLPSPGRGWRSGGGELRFSLWLARNAWRGRRHLEALAWPPRVLGRAVLAFAGSRVGSGCELAPQLAPEPDGVTLEGRLAWRDGAPVPGSSVVRSFRVTGDGLEVDERLAADGGARGVRFHVPRRASDVRREGTWVRYRLA